MKTSRFAFLHAPHAAVTALILAGALSCAAHAAPASEWRPLFNGTDFSGWESWLAMPLPTSNVPDAKKDASGKYTKPLGLNNDPLHAFSVVLADSKPGIRVSGEGYGVLSTTEVFSNFHLRVEFKWGEKRFGPAGKPRNGGLIYHAHGEYGEWGGRWMSGLQFQIAEGTCGDFIVMGDSTGLIRVKSGGNEKAPRYDPSGEPLTLVAPGPAKGVCGCSENFEKPAGEWNVFEVFAVGDKVVHVLNGHVVARAENLRWNKDGKTQGADKNAPLTGGKIQLQMEGAEEIFRNIEVREISEIPAELRNAP